MKSEVGMNCCYEEVFKCSKEDIKTSKKKILQGFSGFGSSVGQGTQREKQRVRQETHGYTTPARHSSQVLGLGQGSPVGLTLLQGRLLLRRGWGSDGPWTKQGVTS